MRITFAHQKNAKKAHFKVHHGNLRETDFEEVFAGPIVVVGQQGRVLKAVGRTLRGRFLTVVFIRVRSDHHHVITGWPSKRKQILQWHKEMRRR